MSKKIGNEIYESDQLVSDYLFFHYGSSKDFMPWEFGPQEALDFTKRTVDYAQGRRYTRALDLGCAVGRSSFELTRYAESVVGVDYSHAFIEMAKKLSWGEVMRLRRKAGEFTIKVPDDLNASAVKFAQGDAMELKNYPSFDLVHAANLLCRLPSPKRFLQALPDLLNPGGRVILATPFSWLEEYTPRDEWPDGDSWNWLCRKMEHSFKLVNEGDEPFLIREHVRKYQWCVSKVSVWELK